MGNLFSRIWKKNEYIENDIENIVTNSCGHDEHDEHEHDEHDEQTQEKIEKEKKETVDDEEMISYPDIITTFNFQYYFRMKTKQEPKAIHWNLFMNYDVNHTQTITFYDFLKIIDDDN